MSLFAKRAPKELVSSDDLAAFGKAEFLGFEAMGYANRSQSLDLMEPYNRDYRVITDVDFATQVSLEVLKNASKGPWEAVGAWKFATEHTVAEDFQREATDLGMLALAKMRVTNLAIHLGPKYFERYRSLTGGPVPDDGFFGPPVFDSNYGPTKHYYWDAAVAAAAARRPRRIECSPGIQPPIVDDAGIGLWDFAMLVLRGPLNVAPDQKSEKVSLLSIVAAAESTDHELLMTDVMSQLRRREVGFLGWSYFGGGRFIEDYLDPNLMGTSLHEEFVSIGLQQLSENGMFEASVSLETLSEYERSRL